MMCIGGMSAWVVSQHTTLMKIAHGMNEMKSCDMFFFYFHFCSCSLCVCFGVSHHRLRRKLFIFLLVGLVLHTAILFIRMQWTHGREITRQNILNSLFSPSGSRAHVCVWVRMLCFLFSLFFYSVSIEKFPTNWSTTNEHVRKMLFRTKLVCWGFSMLCYPRFFRSWPIKLNVWDNLASVIYYYYYALIYSICVIFSHILNLSFEKPGTNSPNGAAYHI